MRPSAWATPCPGPGLRVAVSRGSRTRVSNYTGRAVIKIISRFSGDTASSRVLLAMGGSTVRANAAPAPLEASIPRPPKAMALRKGHAGTTSPQCQ